MNNDKRKFKLYTFVVSILFATEIFNYIANSNIKLWFFAVKTLKIIGYHFTNNYLIINNHIIIINNFCSGFFSIMIFLITIYTLTNRKNKAYLAITGSIFLFLLNILRLIIIIEASKIINIEFLHIFGWFIMSIAIILIWYFES